MRPDLDSYLSRVRERVNEELARHLTPIPQSDPLRLAEAMAASVLDGGKRLRPCLLVAACEAVGGTLEQALGPACAMELVHAYSLVHDDLPAMDDDTERRGRPTCHVRFGETTAVLAGDALLTLAFEVLAAGGQQHGSGLAVLRATLELARAAGAAGMVGGQAMDMDLKRGRPSFEELERCHAAKTAALFSASAAMGAVVGGGEEHQVSLLRSYGFDLGLAFQHADDLKDNEHPEHRQRALARALELVGRAAAQASELGVAGAQLSALADWLRERTIEAGQGCGQ